MSWLEDQLPDFSDPKQMALWGALGGLAKSATPQYGPTGKGVTGMGAGTGLMGILSNVLGGTVSGAQGAQGYQKEQLANQQAQQMNPLDVQAKQMTNQMGQLSLDKAQALQPMQLDMIKNLISGGSSMPGSLAGGVPKDYQMTPVDGLFGRARSEAMMAAASTGDFSQLSKVDQAWAEHSPALANAIKAAETQAAPQKTAQGTYEFMQPPAYQANFGSMAPHITSAAIQGIAGDREQAPQGPGAQEQPPQLDAPQIPQMDASALMAPQPKGPIPPPMGGQQGQPPMPSPGGGSPMPAPQPVQGPQQLPPPRDAAFMPPQPPQGQSNLQQVIQQQQSAPQGPEQFNAADGKPIIPSIKNASLFKPDPSMTPRLNTKPESNTETAVAANKEMTKNQLDNIYKGDESFAANVSSLSTEKYRIQQLVNLYQETQSGTAMAQLPELTNRAIAAGIISDPKTIKNLSNLQTALANHTLQIIQQIKDTNSNPGAAPTRTFGSEVSSMIETGETMKDQPEALFKLLTQAGGLVDQHLDLVNSWQKVGGTGNRLANGYTMSPQAFGNQFLAAHPAESYRAKMASETAPFKGMPGNNGAAPKYTEGQTATNPKTGHKMTFKNGAWQ